MRHACHVCVVALLLAGHARAHAQHWGAREQWQPQVVDTDARLERSVEMEITGRAAVPALAALSERTGVSLGVAPEDVNTVGERKLTVIAQRCSLRAIMVQVATALRECHWDIDGSGPEPVYLLHRNAGVEYTEKWLARQRASAQADEQRAHLEARLAEVRHALAMSPEDLAGLEESDIFLARAVRDEDQRSAIEAFLSLPPEAMERFLTAGSVDMSFAEPPELVQKQARKAAEALEQPDFAASGRTVVTRESLAQAQATADAWRLQYLYVGSPETRDGPIVFTLLVPVAERRHPISMQSLVVPPMFADAFFCGQPGGPLYRLLVASGTPEAQAEEIRQQQVQQAEQLAQEWFSRRREREWVRPSNPKGDVAIKLDTSRPVDAAELQQMLAHQTGLSIISDYFVDRPQVLPTEAAEEMPLWRLLYLVGEVYGLKWEIPGNCLTFHHAQWYELAPEEIPESVIANCRERLRAHGELTLRDVAELAAALGPRSGSVGKWPAELGLFSFDHDSRWALLLYSELSAEQATKAESTSGLSFDEMTQAQRKRVMERAAACVPTVASDAASQASFHVDESISERPERGVRVHSWTLWLDFGDRREVAQVMCLGRMSGPGEERTTRGGSAQ